MYTIKLVTLSRTHAEGNRKHRDKREGELRGIYPVRSLLYDGYLLFIFKVKDLSVFVYRHIPVSSP